MNDPGLSSDRPSGSPRPSVSAVPATLAALPRRYLIDAHVRRAATAPDAPPRLRVTGRDTETGQAVFIKLSSDGESIRREAAVLARLDHPGLARLMDWGMHAAGGYLVLELVPGASLERRLRDDGPARSVQQVRPLLTALADTVAVLHRGGILHRDLKPANIVVRPDGSAVIIDFGAARALSAGPEDESADDFASEGYAAPEQYEKGGSEGPWTDVYALAAIGCRILTGAPPLPAPLRLRSPSERLPALDRIAAADPALAEALAWGLCVDPEGRPPTIAAWCTALAVPDDLPQGPGLAEPPMPPLAFGEADAAGNDGPLDHDEGPPTLPIQRSTDGPVAFAAVVSPLSTGTARSPAGSWRRQFLVALLAAGLIVPAVGWLVGPSYRRQMLKEWTVNTRGQGDTRSITEAIARAPDGARIRIDAGTYAESLVLDRPLHLEATDPASPPVLAPPAGSCLVISGDAAIVRGLVMRGAPAATAEGSPISLTSSPSAPDPATSAPPCVVVTGGAPLLEANRITAPDGPAIDVQDGATPVIRANTVAETPTPSIRVVNGARPLIENNTIEASGSLLLTAGGGGTLRGNRIHDARDTAVQVAAGAAPEISGNTIERPAQSGIFIYDEGKGRIHDNDIVEARLSGIVIATGAPDIVGNTIRGAGEHGILILEADGGRVADNVVEGSKGHGIVVGTDAVLELSGNRTDGNRTPEIVDLRWR